MKTVGIRELKEHTSEILRELQQNKETVEVTNRGEVVALLIPVNKPGHTLEPPDRALWTDMDRLTAEISARWPKDVSAVDAILDVRREL